MGTLRKMLTALAVAAFAIGSAAASDETDVTSLVHQFVEALNAGNPPAILAGCADQMSIIDEYPPHEWHGTGACAQWIQDYVAAGMSDAVITLGKAQHVDIAAGRAYAVFPADLTFKRQGKETKEAASTVAVTLQKGKAGWQITGWAWARH